MSHLIKNLKNETVAIFLIGTCISSPGQELVSTDRKPVEQAGIIAFNLVHNKTIIPVKIGDSRILRIVLDTGMGWDGIVITNPDLSDSIELINPIEASLGGAGNSDQSTAHFSDSMSFLAGDIKFNNQRIVVLRQGGFKGGSFDGVTGYSVFGHYVVEVNYDRSEILLHKQGEMKIDDSWTEIPIYFKENMIPWTDATITIRNEKPVVLSCYIDYASSEAIELLLKPGMKFTLPDKTVDYYLGRGLSGDINGKKGRIAKVIIGPYELKEVVAAFAPAEVRSKQTGADGVISNNLLRRFNLVFDYQQKKLFIKPNSHFMEPFS
jgi:hypothetical protein